MFVLYEHVRMVTGSDTQYECNAFATLVHSLCFSRKYPFVFYKDIRQLQNITIYEFVRFVRNFVALYIFSLFVQ